MLQYNIEYVDLVQYWLDGLLIFTPCRGECEGRKIGRICSFRVAQTPSQPDLHVAFTPMYRVFMYYNRNTE